MLCDVESEAIQTKNKATSKDAVEKLLNLKTIRNNKQHVIPIMGDPGYSTITFRKEEPTDKERVPKGDS